MADPSDDSPMLVSRRALLKSMVLAGGGFMIGVGLPRADDTGGDASLSDDFVPNAWVAIHASGRIELMLARSEMGQGVMTSLPMLLAEELDIGLEQVDIVSAPLAPAYLNRLLGEQATGESTSLRDAWTGLREAGALARTLLITAAAQRWQVLPEQCRARHAIVTHPDGVQTLTYAELARAAARLALPSRVALKAPTDWWLIGTPEQRCDISAKVCGRAAFGLDVRLPGMRYASVARCPVIGARITGWDDRETLKVAGVRAVLATRYGVAVVAEHSWAALLGRKRLVLRYRPRGNSAVDSRRLRQRLSQALIGRAALARRTGDVSAALAGAVRQIESIYTLPLLAHACFEPMNCTADVRADGCDIHVPTQSQRGVARLAERLTGLAAERIRVHTTYLGGGLGRRREQDFVADAVELSQRFKQPVQVLWTREDDFRHDYFLPMTMHRLRGGIDAEGRIIAWFHRLAGPSLLARTRPAAIRDGLDPYMLAGADTLPYRIADQRVEYRRVDLPVPVGYARGGGFNHNIFATECFIDELARLAERDPLVVRRELLAGQPRALAALAEAAELANWDTPLAAGFGRGLALCLAYESLIALVAEVTLDADRIRVVRVSAAVDCGCVIHPDIVSAQIESGIVQGLTAALKGAITLRDGQVEQQRFADYPLLRADEMPEVAVRLLPSTAAPGGVNGLALPAVAPAVANALFALTGMPVRRLPIQAEGSS